MPTKARKDKTDWSTYKLASKPWAKKKQAELEQERKSYTKLKEEVDDESKQKINQVLDVSDKMYYLDKNNKMCPTEFRTLVVKTLSESNDVDLKNIASLLARQIQNYDTAVQQWRVPSNRSSALVSKINNNHNKLLSAFEAYKELILAEVAAQNPNSERAKAALTSTNATLQKAKKKNPNNQVKKSRDETKEAASKAERALEEQLTNPSGKSDKENQLIEEGLRQDLKLKRSNTTTAKAKRRRDNKKEAAASAKVALQVHRANPSGKSDKENRLITEQLEEKAKSTYDKTPAAESKRKRDKKNEQFNESKAKLNELEHKKNSMPIEEYTQTRDVLLEDAAKKKTKTRKGQYQLQNTICDIPKEDLVTIAVGQMSDLHIPLSAPERSKQMCDQFSEAFRTNDDKKLLSLIFDN